MKERGREGLTLPLALAETAMLRENSPTGAEVCWGGGGSEAPLMSFSFLVFYLARKSPPSRAKKTPCAITELPLHLAPPTERAPPRGLQQTWLAAPVAHAAALAAPLRLPALAPSPPRVETNFACGDSNLD